MITQFILFLTLFLFSLSFLKVQFKLLIIYSVCIYDHILFLFPSFNFTFQIAFTKLYSDENSSQYQQNLQQEQYQQILTSPYLIQIPYEYIIDQFNLTDLNLQLQNFNQAYTELIQAYESQDDTQIQNPETFLLYGLLHKRYIHSDQGLYKLYKNVVSKIYGTCLRQGCADTPLCPVGISDKIGISPIVCYCCRWENPVDGSFFGRDICWLLYLQYPGLEQKSKQLKEENVELEENMKYCGKQIYGFKINELAYKQEFNE